MTHEVETTVKCEPHWAFNYIRPDEVAEWWSGFGNTLYKALWNSMSDVKPIRGQDAIGLNTVASVWDRFTPEQQMKLNELADYNDTEYLAKRDATEG